MTAWRHGGKVCSKAREEVAAWRHGGKAGGYKLGQSSSDQFSSVQFRLLLPDSRERPVSSDQWRHRCAYGCAHGLKPDACTDARTDARTDSG
eukprot:gene14440-biopygen2344